MLFPVLVETPAVGQEYLTLEEGIEGKLVRVTEVGQRETAEQSRTSVTEIEAALASEKQTQQAEVRGDVNKLLVHNHGDKPLFILAGQTVCGGKQDRICPEDVVIPPHTSNHELEVFCVESGRWHVDSPTTVNFGFSEVAVDEVRKTARADKDQGKVWDTTVEVSTWSERAVGYNPDIGSGTNAYLEAVSDPKLKAETKPFIDALSGKWKDEKKLAGFVVVVDGRIKSADVFNDPAMFAKLHDKLLESYAARAVLVRAVTEKKTGDDKAKAPEPAKPVTKADVEAFLKTAYGHRGELSNDGVFTYTDPNGACFFESVGGDMKCIDNVVQHLYMSVEEKKDAQEKPPDTRSIPAEDKDTPED
jgi:hypothetical protein